MKFRTEVPIVGGEPKIDYRSKLLLLGSCFATNIGRKLNYFQFQILENPFGILFHPAAISSFLRRCVSVKPVSKEDLVFHADQWHSLEAHSCHSNVHPELVVNSLNQALLRTSEFLSSASHVVLSLGTAWAYRKKDLGELVANCHKIPQNQFLKELSQPEEHIRDIVGLLIKANPEISIIFTISPVRHLKDGFTENQRSKARLIEAVHAVVEDGKNLHYFPSYEIQMDDLRDYRFYAGDMLHPSESAIDYIWDNFSQAWISKEAIALMKEVDKVQKGRSHRPFDANSPASQKFQENLEQKIERLRKFIPHLDKSGFIPPRA